MSNNIKRIFFEACIFGDMKNLLRLCKKHSTTKDTIDLWSVNWILGSGCRYCEKKVKEKDFCITTTYWWPRWATSHKQCKEMGEKIEAYECQTIDASHNDCKYFQREHFDEKRKGDKGFIPKIGVWVGYCTKCKKEVTTSRNFSENIPCFVHRDKEKFDKIKVYV